MGVVLATTDEPLYLPRCLAPVFDAHGDDIEHVLLVPPHGSQAHEAVRYARMLGPRGLLSLGVPFLFGALAAALPDPVERRLTGRHHSIADLAAGHDTPIRHVTDVTAPAFTDWLESRSPTTLLSVVCGHRLPERVLDIPGTAVNLHWSLLPRYRGRATAFWPLYYGDDETGVTAHVMTPRFDDGPILAQHRFRIDPDDTLHDVRLRLARTSGDLAVDLLHADLDEVPRRPNPTTIDDYHTLPTAAERREFRARGNRFR